MTASPATRKRNVAILVINAAIVLFELAGLRESIITHGAGLFQFYTQDSNLFALFACAALAVSAGRGLAQNGKPVLKWVWTAKYMATCCLAVTLVVVLFVLSPMEGEGGYRVMMLSGSMLYHHLICPVLALGSFIFLEAEAAPGRRQEMLSLLPTLVYAVVAVALNLLSLLDGPYPFLRVRQQSALMSVVWFTAILGGAWLLAWAIAWANRKFAVKVS